MWPLGAPSSFQKCRYELQRGAIHCVLMGLNSLNLHFRLRQGFAIIQWVQNCLGTQHFQNSSNQMAFKVCALGALVLSIFSWDCYIIVLSYSQLTSKGVPRTSKSNNGLASHIRAMNKTLWFDCPQTLQFHLHATSTVDCTGYTWCHM